MPAPGPAGPGCLLAALVVQAALILLPATFLGGWGKALGDPVVTAFVAATTVFCLVDLRRGLQRLAAGAPVRARDPVADRLSSMTGTMILFTFWAALSERLSGFLGEPWGWGVRGTGMAMLLAGIALRRAAIRQLGEFFVTELRVLEGQPLQQSGVYARVRHPSELGLLAVVLGSCLWLGSLIGLGAFFLLILPAVIVRVRRENAVLRSIFGTAYDEYARRVWNLVPWVY